MKKILVALSFYCCCFLSFAQGSYYDENLSSNVYQASQVIGNITVQPPDVAAFQKVNFVPVSNYTGRANISIPIYEVSAGSMSVPISISYNSSGVKVGDMASSVGLNWSLNAGGMISRSIKGMDDFKIPQDAGSPIPYMTSSGWLGYTHPNVNVYGDINRYNDASPDLFVVNAPGLSTKYIHEKPYTTNSNGTVSLINNGIPDPIELEQQGNIIDETIGLVVKNYLNDYTGTYNNMTRFGLENVNVTSTTGIVYSFASPDISRHHGAPNGSDMYKIESYRLDKMFDPSTNQTIDFVYEQYSNYFYDNKLSKNYPQEGGSNISFGNDIKYNVYPVTQRLKKIIFDKGEVEFIYGLNREDNSGDKALTEIKVKDTDGNVIKHMKLNFGYFQSSIASGPQSKRLRLDRVYEVDASLNELPGHTFTYDTAYQMPPRDSYAADFLGYNNGSYNASITNPIPKFYKKNNKISPFYDATATALIGNYSLESNVNYAKTYSLTKITFPTGGYNEYEYELNQFYYSGTKNGGGLRVKSQTLVDTKGGLEILDYTYSNGNIAAMPVYAVFGNNGYDTFAAPQAQLEFTQGSFVGYSNVTVENRVNNGYTTYAYSSPSSDPNLASLKSNDYGGWVNKGTPSLSVDRDFLRGKILSETVYNQANKKRIKTSYNYTTKTFSTLSLTYLNKASTSSSCYSPENGGYNFDSSNCKGYKETVNLPIARDVMTTVITEDYQSDQLGGGFESDLAQTLRTTQSYTHDKQFPLVIEEIKSVSVCEPLTQGGEQNCAIIEDDEYSNSRVVKIVTYPITGGTTMQSNTSSTEPYVSNLITQNRLTTPINIKYLGTNLDEEQVKYKDFGNGVIALEKIDFKARDNTIAPTGIVTKRDAKGRVIEYQKANGLYVANIYGYNDTYLVAEVINSTYNAVISALQNANTTYNQVTFANDSSIRALMNEVRTALPNAQITSYTYKPLVGVNSITDPVRQVVYYHYDGFNRLESVTDVDGRVVSKNEYHYKNQ